MALFLLRPVVSVPWVVLPTKNAAILPADYAGWLASLKRRIAGARQRVLLAANQEQIHLYHEIGREILDRQSRQGWGTKVVFRPRVPGK